MIKRLLIAALFGALPSLAFAACPANHAAVTDSASSSFNMGLVSDANGNCTNKVDIDTGSQLHADMTAALPVNVGSTPTPVQGRTVNSETGMSVDINSLNNTLVDTNSGNKSAGTQRVVLATDQPALTNPLLVTQSANADPCSASVAKSTAAFSSSSGGPVSIVALSGSTKVYVCAIAAVTDTAIKLSFIDGTGGSCASAQHALIGSTTATNGMSLPATGGFTMGSGNGTVAVTAAASALCFLQSGTSLVAGTVSYVQQ